MPEFSVFKLKSPRDHQTNIRIKGRTGGLTPIEPIVVQVPSRKEVALVFLAMIPVLAIAIMLFAEALGGFEYGVSVSRQGGSGFQIALLSPAILFFCSVWYPIQAVKKRRDAIRVNAWEPIEKANSDLL